MHLENIDTAAVFKDFKCSKPKSLSLKLFGFSHHRTLQAIILSSRDSFKDTLASVKICFITITLSQNIVLLLSNAEQKCAQEIFSSYFVFFDF